MVFVSVVTMRCMYLIQKISMQISVTYNLYFSAIVLSRLILLYVYLINSHFFKFEEAVISTRGISGEKYQPTEVMFFFKQKESGNWQQRLQFEAQSLKILSVFMSKYVFLFCLTQVNWTKITNPLALHPTLLIGTKCFVFVSNGFMIKCLS